jgi:hypothetical protein
MAANAPGVIHALELRQHVDGRGMRRQLAGGVADLDQSAALIQHLDARQPDVMSHLESTEGLGRDGSKIGGLN